MLLAYDVAIFMGSKLPPWEDIDRKLGVGPPVPDMTDEEIMHAMDLHIVGMTVRGMTPQAV